MKKLSLALALVMLLAGCTQNPDQLQGSLSGDDSVTEGDQAAAEIGQNTKQRIAVEEIPLYEQLSLEDGQTIKILDIDEHRILLAVNIRNATSTECIQIYDMRTEEIILTEYLSDVYVFYGKFVEDDYVYSAVEAEKNLEVEADHIERESGYVRRVGTHPWEYALTKPLADEDVMPMPIVLEDGNVVFIDCGGVYYGEKTFMSEMSLVVVSPDGTAKTLFTPDVDQFMAYSRMIAYGDGYVFRLRTSSGFEFYEGDKDHVERIMVFDNCRAIYPYWTSAGDKFLFSMGYGNDEVGITDIKTIVTTADGTIVTIDDVAYFRLTSDGNGTVAAIDSGWTQVILTVENGTIAATRIDLPAGITGFYPDGNGTLYAHLQSSDTGKVGLYKIVT
jgi:hypothetical protein